MAGDPKTDPDDSISIDTIKIDTRKNEISEERDASDKHVYQSLNSTSIQKQSPQTLNRSQILNILDENGFNRHLFQVILTACLGIFTVCFNYK
jgi:hypothetical protein